MGSSEKEVCAKCNREIDRSEQACVFNGEIVCAECDKKLRGGSGLQTVRKSELAKNAKQENKSLDKHQKLKLNCP